MIWALASEARSNDSAIQDETKIIDAIVAELFPTHQHRKHFVECVMTKTAKYPHRIEFRVTAEEYQRAEQLASQSDVTVSNLLRVLLQQAESTDPTRTKQLIKLYQRLGSLAQNLNQLNRNQPSKSGSTSLDEAVELINEARKLIIQSIQ